MNTNKNKGYKYELTEAEAKAEYLNSVNEERKTIIAICDYINTLHEQNPGQSIFNLPGGITLRRNEADAFAYLKDKKNDVWAVSYLTEGRELFFSETQIDRLKVITTAIATQRFEDTLETVKSFASEAPLFNYNNKKGNNI